MPLSRFPTYVAITKAKLKEWIREVGEGRHDVYWALRGLFSGTGR